MRRFAGYFLTLFIMVNKILCAAIVVIFCFANNSASGQLSGRKDLYKFTEPYFMGEGLSYFLYTKVNLKAPDWNTGIQGISVLVFKLTKNHEIKDLKVLDSTNNENYNRQVYDAIADHPKSWELAALNGKPVDVHIRVKVSFSTITNPGSMGSGSPMSRMVLAGKEAYNIIGDFEYLVDNLLANNFYEEGVAMSAENNFKEAIKFFDVVVSFSPAEVDALFNRAICKYKDGDKEGACIDWKKIQSMGKTDADKLILKYCNP